MMVPPTWSRHTVNLCQNDTSPEPGARHGEHWRRRRRVASGRLVLRVCFEHSMDGEAHDKRERDYDTRDLKYALVTAENGLVGVRASQRRGSVGGGGSEHRG